MKKQTMSFIAAIALKIRPRAEFTEQVKSLNGKMHFEEIKRVSGKEGVSWDVLSDKKKNDFYKVVEQRKTDAKFEKLTAIEVFMRGL